MDSLRLPQITDYLKSISPFSLLPESVIEDIGRDVEIVAMKKNEQFSSSDSAEASLYLIQSGVVEQRLPSGELRAKLGQNDVFGFNLHNENYQIEAIEDCLMYRFNHSSLLEKVADYEHVTNQLASRANLRLHSSVKVQWSESEKGVFFKTVKEIARSRPAIASSAMTIQQVARLMRHESNSSCAVIIDDGHLNGMVTDKDMTKRVVSEALDVTRPICDIMTTHPYTVSQDDLVLSAVSLMMTHNIQNLPVLDSNQQVIGLITPQQLVQKHSVQAVFLIEKIGRCKTLSELSALASERQAIFEAMVEASLPSHLIGHALTSIYDAFTCQLLKLSEDIMGKPPCRYAWLAAGSHARGEIHLASDQDNALVLEDGASESDRLHFRHVAMYVCKGLAECGYSLCSGRFMAATPKWNQPLSTWKQYYNKWSNNPEYDMLLQLTVFLDIRFLTGDEVLYHELNKERLAQATNNSRLMSALVRNMLKTRPPLGIFNNLVLEKHGQNEKTLNIKKAAISSLVDIARIYALNEGADILTTEERLAFVSASGSLNEGSYQDLLGTYRYVTQIRYLHHLECLHINEVISNDIDPNHFGSFERQHLKDAFRIVSGFQDVLKMKFN